MSDNIFSNEIINVISNYTSLNPTGILQLSDSGSFKMNGSPSQIMTASQIAKQNLNDSNSNKFICDKKIENFENYNPEIKLEKKSNNIIYLVIGLFLLLVIFLFIYKKRKI
jgi:LPXTG-motif cell wall-anchored protein